MGRGIGRVRVVGWLAGIDDGMDTSAFLDLFVGFILCYFCDICPTSHELHSWDTRPYLRMPTHQATP